MKLKLGLDHDLLEFSCSRFKLDSAIFLRVGSYIVGVVWRVPDIIHIVSFSWVSTMWVCPLSTGYIRPRTEDLRVDSKDLQMVLKSFCLNLLEVSHFLDGFY